MSLSSDNNGKNHYPCYALKAKPLNARPVDAKRCRSGRGLLRNAKPLTGRDSETKKKEKKKKKKF